MSHVLTATTHFKKQFKQIKNNSRWAPIFTGHVPFDSQQRSPWDYIKYCFLTGKSIPIYFYVHPLHVSKITKQQLKRRLGFNQNVKIQVLELHFDGHSGDHLLVFYHDKETTIYLAIGTHSSLF